MFSANIAASNVNPQVRMLVKESSVLMFQVSCENIVTAVLLHLYGKLTKAVCLLKLGNNKNT